MFCTTKEYGQRFEEINKNALINKLAREATNLILETGYSVEEMAKVEYAFEMNTQLSYESYTFYTEQEILEDQFIGLSAVIDILLSFEPAEEENNPQQLKDRFKQHPKLIAI